MTDRRFVMYEGQTIGVRGGAWLDIMNSWLYTVVKEDVRIDGMRGTICREREVDGGKIFFLTPDI